jgi:hypothetical protein
MTRGHMRKIHLWKVEVKLGMVERSSARFVHVPCRHTSDAYTYMIAQIVVTQTIKRGRMAWRTVRFICAAFSL